MRYDFYAYMDRMKYIKRWQLMRSTRDENIMEHSQSVAMLAHALVTIHNDVFGGNADVLKTVLYAIYHETSEVMTGDLPTPIKYYNKSIHGAYKELERSACEKIVATLSYNTRALATGQSAKVLRSNSFHRESYPPVTPLFFPDRDPKDEHTRPQDSNR